MTQRPELAYQNTQYDMSERDRLIMEELPQVHYIASRIRERLPQHVALEDLVNAGVLGLIEAISKYDASKSVQFKTFAKFRIHGAIIDSLREMDWGSRLLRRKGREIEDAIGRLEVQFGRQPNEEEIAKELKIELKELHALLSKLDGLFLVSQQVSASFDRSETRDLIETAPSRCDDSFDIVLRGETSELLSKAIANLDERSQRVLSLYYREELTMKEIALVLEIAESRVSQLHSSALLKLRLNLKKKLSLREPSVAVNVPNQVEKRSGGTTWARY
jgi:RNA polymerase sigma factor for flagellar operon FliA